MDNPLYAMLFAEDLIEYILNKFGFHWKRTEGVGPLRQDIPKNRFRTEIGEAVYSILELNEDVCKKDFAKLVKGRLTSLENFRYKCGLNAVLKFTDGFQLEKYLIFCATLAAPAWQCFEELNYDIASDIASVSAQVLAFIMNFYIYKGEFNPLTDWFLLAVSAQKLRRFINRERKMKNEPCSGKS